MSRTSTTQWKNLRAKIIADTRSQGRDQCPWCQQQIAWDTSNTNASPEVDHIIPHSQGGTDTYHNLQVLCRTCNRKKGNRTTPPLRKKPVRTSRKW